VAAGCDAGVIGVYRRAWSCEGHDMLCPSCCKYIRRAVGSQSPRPHRRRRRGGAVMGSGVRTDGGVAFGDGGDPMWGAAAQRRRRAARSADHRQQCRCHAADRAAPVITVPAPCRRRGHAGSRRGVHPRRRRPRQHDRRRQERARRHRTPQDAPESVGPRDGRWRIGGSETASVSEPSGAVPSCDWSQAHSLTLRRARPIARHRRCWRVLGASGVRRARGWERQQRRSAMQRRRRRRDADHRQATASVRCTVSLRLAAAPAAMRRSPDQVGASNGGGDGSAASAASAASSSMQVAAARLMALPPVRQ